jgi:hypothetical protein
MVDAKRYQQQLTNLNSLLFEYRKRQHKVIFFHDSAPSHMAKPVCSTLETVSWEALPHTAYSSDLAPNYHLFA